ncbi:APC family permease [Rhodopseudomonas sp. P2A-2r]|uniref:APC family permease n=1 Tax=Rhodopseudomonas sp. P2A-2r TaxID=2991972 RepID=UPI002234CEE3|nr:APC family permease [Rhodopseudomonas sp. P2A-2r]UZE49356.1 APC family permease [Rhodopseudomonas sp. P2A-2r]
MPDPRAQESPALRRRLGLPLLTLYGIGITVGAGIYVLIGAVAGQAGVYAPWSFVLAAVVMAFTVASYAELSTRFPVSAGEAAYVRAAFGSRTLSTATGLLTIVIGVVSSSTVTLGAIGYLRQFVDLPQGILVLGVVALLAAVAAWGILESVVLAGIFTLVEVGGLLIVIVAAVRVDLPIGTTLAKLPPPEIGALSGIGFASLLAFFAFIGFEDLANVVEEAENPRRDIPRAMALTLLVSTVLYVVVAAVAVTAVSTERLAASAAPLSLVFREVAGVSPATISVIAIVATLNTILAQMTMAARVIYGMARQGDLPVSLGAVHQATGTPLLATALIAAAVILLALGVSFVRLAEWTSLATLAVFALVNLALLWLRWRGVTSAQPHVTVPAWIPAAGLFSCLVMIAAGLLR